MIHKLYVALFAYYTFMYDTFTTEKCWPEVLDYYNIIVLLKISRYYIIGT